MRPNVDEVDLYSTRELADATPLTPDGSWLVPLCNPLTGISYKASQELIGAILTSYLGSGIVLPDRVYRIGTSLPSGATIGTYTDTDSLVKGYINDPYLDGKVYSVNRRGIELMVKGVEWDNDDPDMQVRLLKVNGNGEGDVFSDDEIIIIQFQPQISPIIAAPDAIARFTSGVYPISGNATLTASSYRKLIVITSRGVITLGADYPENVICAFTQNSTNNGQSTITAPDGQSIAYNGSTVSVIWLGKNERLGLIRSGTTWYVAYEHTGYERVGTIVAGRLVRPNQIIGQGQTVLRADYPRLLNYLIELNTEYPGVVLNAGSWASAKTYWGWGDGSTTIQVPDLRGYFPRWLDLGAGVDADRVSSGLQNKPGSAQSHQVGESSFTIQVPRGDTYNGNPYDSSRAGRGQDNNPRSPLNIPVTINSGKETRPINAGEIPLIYV